MIEDGAAVVVSHTGVVHQVDGAEFRFVACDVFTFDGELISRVESYVAPVSAPPADPL